MADVEDADGEPLIVDAVDDPVGAAACSVSVIQRRAKPFARSVRIIQKRPDDELVRRRRDSVGEPYGKLAPSGGRDD